MIEKSQLIGKRITRLYQTPWKEYEGFEMPGVAGKRWYSCDCFIELETGQLLKLDERDITLATGQLPALIEAEPMGDSPQGFLGEKIRKVAISSPGDHLIVILDRDNYIENDHCIPGGNRVWLGNFRDWDTEDKEEMFVDYWDRKPVVPWDQ